MPDLKEEFSEKFAVKLNEELVAKLHKLAEAREGDLNTVVAELLKKGMENKSK